ncbi:SpoIIE family protein phosphatase [Synechococcus sp. CBW1107]|uniref:SpoIIE family protein phosphatase n=1 Tax=Synechococcus sp. CBW1107 TaxID=2789857 RepID=UPI002AD55BB5|nr:SpoIIE family protein phosphatase [Synechococcus sp. CBW1107]CAK6688512.1 Regulator of RpoS [Synechococcus sp. CBW1107]
MNSDPSPTISSATTILLIDDDRILQHILSGLLKAQGCQVLTATDGSTGLELARRHRPQLVLCDWSMAGMDGLEVCRRFKQDTHLAAIYFILLTSRSSLVERVEGLDAGADDFLSKPVEPSDLLARVRSGLRLYQANHELLVLSQDLAAQKQKLEDELSSAADYVRSILPSSLEGAVGIESLFMPCQQLGGDCLDYYWLDENQLILYLLDVSGHGLAAALPSISVHNLLRSRVLTQADLGDPAAVLGYLNTWFQMDRQNNQYFTLWYGVYDKRSAVLHYASAGHPPALLFTPDAQQGYILQELKAPGLPIGLFEGINYSTHSCSIEPGALLYLYSDGIYEVPTSEAAMWELEDFRRLLREQIGRGSTDLQQLVEAIRACTGCTSFPDDASVIAARFSAGST